MSKSNWQPIETAPINASVLVFIPNADHYGHGVYRAMQVDMGTGRRWMTTAWACGRDLVGDVKPTFWMPLPEAPIDAQPLSQEQAATSGGCSHDWQRYPWIPQAGDKLVRCSKCYVLGVLPR